MIDIIIRCFVGIFTITIPVMISYMLGNRLVKWSGSSEYNINPAQKTIAGAVALIIVAAIGTVLWSIGGIVLSLLPIR